MHLQESSPLILKVEELSTGWCAMQATFFSSCGRSSETCLPGHMVSLAQFTLRIALREMRFSCSLCRQLMHKPRMPMSNLRKKQTRLDTSEHLLVFSLLPILHILFLLQALPKQGGIAGVAFRISLHDSDFAVRRCCHGHGKARCPKGRSGLGWTSAADFSVAIGGTAARIELNREHTLGRWVCLFRCLWTRFPFGFPVKPQIRG